MTHWAMIPEIVKIAQKFRWICQVKFKFINEIANHTWFIDERLRKKCIFSNNQKLSINMKIICTSHTSDQEKVV